MKAETNGDGSSCWGLPSSQLGGRRSGRRRGTAVVLRRSHSRRGPLNHVDVINSDEVGQASRHDPQPISVRANWPSRTSKLRAASTFGPLASPK